MVTSSRIPIWVRLAFILTVAAVSACHTDPIPGAGSPARPSPPPAHLAPDALAPTPAPSSRPTQNAARTPEPTPVPVLPEDIHVGEHTRVAIPNDRDVHVYHAPADQVRALVYLHGVCGNVRAVRSWVDRALTFGTLIELVGDSPCAGRPGRFAWKAPVTSITDRVRVALEVVKAARAGLLDTDHVVLFGYSQGAARAEAMAHAAPRMFTHVVLGSPPTQPDPLLLATCESVVVLGGSEEDTRHLIDGVSALASAGIRARFVSLPGAAHGQYGPNAPEVIAGALAWLLASDEGSAPERP